MIGWKTSATARPRSRCGPLSSATSF